MAQSIEVSLTISADEFLKLYAGTAKTVYARATDGRSIKFPASILQPFVTREGIKGRFIIYFDSANRYQRIERIQ